MSIKYIADLSIRTEYPPELALSALEFDRSANIFIITTKEHPTNNYWTDWGGSYDTPTNQDAEIYFSQFLQKVTSRAVLILTEGSMLIEANNIFINLPKKPWQYSTFDTEYDTVQGYASTVRNELNQSDINYPDSEGNPILHPVRLMIPSVNNKLSDPISGTALQPLFRFTLINNDGKFDDTDENNIINTPTRIKRTSVDNPTLEDFNIIKYGLADSVKVTAKGFTVSAADIFRTLTESVTRKFTASAYPSAPSNTLDKDIPVGWGVLDNVPLFEVATGEYIALDPDFIDAATTVYDEDGASIAFSFDSITGIITATDASTADVRGETSTRLGSIITTEMARVGNIPYVEGPWDKTETDIYLFLSAKSSLYFPGGTLKTLINDVLKSDNAFLFTKNDGRLTLRQWGQTYASHLIDSWKIMKLPVKDNAEGKKYFMSAVTIQTDKNQSTGDYITEYFDDTQQNAIKEIYNKTKTAVFPTGLVNTADIEDLAERLLNRFGNIAEIFKINLAYDTTEINLLDTVILTMTINGRTMSNKTSWIVREVDPAQDVLSLESTG